MVAAPLDNFRRSKDSPMRFQPVSQAERQQYSRHAQEVQRFSAERQKLETSAVRVPVDARTKDFVPGRVKLPGSPIAAKPGADLGKDNAPPKIYEAPKPDRNVAAKPRENRSVVQPQQRTVNKPQVDQPRAQPQPPPKTERVAPQPPPQRQPKAERVVPQPPPQRQPKAERVAPQPPPQRQPKAERVVPQPPPQRQPKAERVAPQPPPQRQPKAERQAPPPQPKAERAPQQPRGKDSAGSPPAGSNQDKPKGKDKK